MFHFVYLQVEAIKVPFHVRDHEKLIVYRTYIPVFDSQRLFEQQF